MPKGEEWKQTYGAKDQDGNWRQPPKENDLRWNPSLRIGLKTNVQPKRPKSDLFLESPDNRRPFIVTRNLNITVKKPQKTRS